MTFRKSTAVARELGIGYHRLFGLLRLEKIPPPQKDTSGDYVWTDKDMQAAREALAAMQSKKLSKEKIEG